MAFIEVSDFRGKYKVAEDQYTVVITTEYIGLYVNQYLARILGASMAQTLLTDMGNNRQPEDENLLVIFNPFTVDNPDYYCGCHNESKVSISTGLRNCVLGFVYWEIMKDKKITPSIATGTALAKGELSTSGSVPAAQVYERYNESVKTCNSIQDYIRSHQDIEIYQSFNGERILLNYNL